MKDESNLLVEKDVNGGRYNSVFEVKLTPQAERSYVRLDPETMERIDRIFEQFEQGNLTLRNIRSLRGQYEGSFRYRLSKWRIIFRIDYAQRVVWVEAVTTRGDAYR